MKFSRLNTFWELEALIEHHNQNSSYVVIDTETTGLDPHTDKLLSIVITGENEDSAVSFSPELALCLKSLTPLLILQNFRFDFHMLKRAGVDLTMSHFRDTMLMDHLRHEEESHSLDSMVKRYFNDNYKEVFWSKYKTIEEAPADERLEYECKDVIYTGKVYEKLLIELKHEEIPDSLVDHVHRLALSLFETEYNGVKIDHDYLVERGCYLQGEINRLVPEMKELVESHIEGWELDAWLKEIQTKKTDKGKNNVKRPEFSFDSSTQLRDLLYMRLKLPVQYDQKTKKPTTGDDALLKLAADHELIPKLREYRGHQKVYGSYIEGTLERQRQGRIYPEFNVNGTKTGRISHSNPNLGQLPSEGGIRGIYIPDDDHCFISADYKQLEVVLAAHFSRDKNLLRVVYEGASLHDITADGLGIPRAQAKTVNFAVQYGAGVTKIEKILECSTKDAQHALDKYWETYYGLKVLIDECHYKVNNGLPIVSPFGRKRHFPAEFEQGWMKARAQRQAFNALIQGTGGDLTSRAFYLVSEAMKVRQLGHSLFTVHDEIIISPYNRHSEVADKLLVETMIQVGEEIGLTVPLAADSSGPMQRWLD